MRMKLASVLVLGLLLTGCSLQRANRLINGRDPGLQAPGTTAPTETPTTPPTNTPVPTATPTLAPTPNPSVVGLPAEPSGSSAFDFVASMCKAQWFTRSGNLPCPGDENNSNGGFVLSLPAERQNLPSGYPVLMMYPPQDNSETIFSRYPAFKVQKGDRFRAVLACRAHTFCDVDFGLGYYAPNGTTGLTHWPYRFTDAPIVVDYSLDGLAGLTVQFSLSLRGAAARLDAYGAWILPHIYRPGS
jgi:hypothetical protein